MCIQGVSGERAISVMPWVCMYVHILCQWNIWYTLSSHTDRLSSSTVRDGRKCTAIWRKIDNIEVLSFFADYHYNNICCFVPGDISFFYRQSISTSLPLYNTTTVVIYICLAPPPAISYYGSILPISNLMFWKYMFILQWLSYCFRK